MGAIWAGSVAASHIYPMLGDRKAGPKLEKCHQLSAKKNHSELSFFVCARPASGAPKIALPPPTMFLKKIPKKYIWPIWHPSPQLSLVFWRRPPWAVFYMALVVDQEPILRGYRHFGFRWTHVKFRSFQVGMSEKWATPNSSKFHLYHDVLHSNCNGLGFMVLQVPNHQSQRPPLSSALQTVGSWWGRRSAGLNSRWNSASLHGWISAWLK